jgi:hypothetical protein
MRLASIRKALTPPVVGLVAWWGDVLTSRPGPITAREWRELAILGAITLGVYAVPNE